MIQITNGQMTLTVPASAFKQIYSASGFHILDGEEHSEAPAETFPTFEEEMRENANLVEETEDLAESPAADESDAEEEVDLSEIPLGEMDFYQLCAYADQLGLDRKGLRSKKELRALIRNNT